MTTVQSPMMAMGLPFSAAVRPIEQEIGTRPLTSLDHPGEDIGPSA
jgi:hypothetical protein